MSSHQIAKFTWYFEVWPAWMCRSPIHNVWHHITAVVIIICSVGISPKCMISYIYIHIHWIYCSRCHPLVSKGIYWRVTHRNMLKHGLQSPFAPCNAPAAIHYVTVVGLQTPWTTFQDHKPHWKFEYVTWLMFKNHSLPASINFNLLLLLNCSMCSGEPPRFSCHFFQAPVLPADDIAQLAMMASMVTLPNDQVVVKKWDWTTKNRGISPIENGKTYWDFTRNMENILWKHGI